HPLLARPQGRRHLRTSVERRPTPMADVPEHLLKRAAERRAALAAQKGGGGGDAAGGEPAAGADDDPDKIPGRLLTGQQHAPATAARESPPRAPPIAAAGPAGHTQRLLTVVKAGSIQDVKASPTDKVHVWPHLLVVEFAASLAMTAFLLVFSTFVNAPL